MPTSQQHILQISELNRKVKFILESEMRTVWLTGEISNFIAASSGHWYLSLKDAKAQVKCAMFKGSNRYVRITPKNGSQVLVKANVTLYEPRGDYQLIIEQMEDAGEGLLQQKYQQLKAQMAAKGLFSQTHKKSLPTYINTVGVITSPTGAAIRDIISVLERRQPNMRIVIYPTLVQGNTAAIDIQRAIELANTRNECDVLIVGRGGGSLEDLWAYNESPVVDAIFASTIPVVSAVGHEIDHSLADLVADIRAATPSAAAELVSKDSEQHQQQLVQFAKRIKLIAIKTLANKKQQCNFMHHRLLQTHPKNQVAIQQQRVDELTRKLYQLTKQRLLRTKVAHGNIVSRLQQQSPQSKLSTLQFQQSQLTKQLTQHIQILLQKKQTAFGSVIDQLHIVSPLATLARGYSISRNSNGDIIRNIKKLSVGDAITTQVADGKIVSEITEIAPKQSD